MVRREGGREREREMDGKIHVYAACIYRAANEVWKQSIDEYRAIDVSIPMGDIARAIRLGTLDLLTHSLLSFIRSLSKVATYHGLKKTKY